MSRHLLRDPVGNGRKNDETDVMNLKRAFASMDRLDAPTRGFRPFIDQELDDAMRRFQEDFGLRTDGVFNPGGESERNLMVALGRRPALAPLRPGVLDLSGPVGNGLEDRTADVRGVQRALMQVGLLKGDRTAEPNGIFTAATEDGIRTFQRRNRLKEDGIINPGGSTVAKLGETLFAQARDATASKAGQNSDQNTDKPEQAGSNPDGEDNKPIEWQGVKHFMDKGSFAIKVKGPVKIEQRTDALGADGFRYEVDWLPLDRNGKVVPEFRRPDHRPSRGGVHVMMLAPDVESFKPPYDNPHGFQATVRIKPGQAVHGNTGGAYLNISIPKGGAVD